MNYLAIDYWTRKIWIAINVENIAVPVCILTNKKWILAELKKIITERKIDKIIIWIANHVDWTESLHTKKIKSFTWVLKKEFWLEVIFHDERFTSFEAKTSMSEIWEKDFDSTKLDDMAACIILQSFLDKNSQNTL